LIRVNNMFLSTELRKILTEISKSVKYVNTTRQPNGATSVQGSRHIIKSRMPGTF
jgi:hypothetical protein